MALSAAQMQEAVIKNLPEKTGKSLQEWISIAQTFKLSKNTDIVKKLKADFGLGHVQAQTIAWRASGEKPYVETKGYEEFIFKQNFELYLQVKQMILGINEDVKAKPCKTYIPFYRKNQFAIVTEKKGALILGLNLSELEFPELELATKLGGSERINKMLIVKKSNLSKLKKYITTAYNNN
jgi:hypothetical protein